MFFSIRARVSYTLCIHPPRPLHPAEYNFDKPEAFDTELLLECLSELKAGRAFDVPVYDFTTHSRRWGPGACPRSPAAADP